jgi:hypothetical protein
MRVFSIVVNENDVVEAIALTDAPAIEEMFVAFNKQRRVYFNDELRMIVSPLLIPNQLIYRYDENGEYYLTIDAANIEKVASKIIGKRIVFNYEHTAKTFDGVELQSVFVSNEKMDIKAPSYFNHLPDKTLYIVAKVNSDEVWSMIKSGEVKGVSIEALFSVEERDISEATTVAASKSDDDEQFLNEIL